MECCSHAHLSTGTLKTGTWCRVCKQWNMYAYLPFHDFRCCEKFDHEVLHLVQNGSMKMMARSFMGAVSCAYSVNSATHFLSSSGRLEQTVRTSSQMWLEWLLGVNWLLPFTLIVWAEGEWDCCVHVYCNGTECMANRYVKASVKYPEYSADVFTQPGNQNSVGLQPKVRLLVTMF